MQLLNVAQNSLRLAAAAAAAAAARPVPPTRRATANGTYRPAREVYGPAAPAT